MSLNPPNPAGPSGPIPEFVAADRWRRFRRVLVLLLVTLIAVPLSMRAESAGASDGSLIQPDELTTCDSTWDCSPPPLLNLDQDYPTAALYSATPAQRTSLRALEKQAISNVIENHGLSAGDTAAVQTWGRDEALAELFTLLLDAIDPANPPRTSDQQNAVDWLTGIVRSRATVAAHAAGREYVKWAGLDEGAYQSLVTRSSTTVSDLTAFLDDNPQPWNLPRLTAGYCGYRSPEPYGSEYTGYTDRTCLATCSNVLGCNPPTPSYDQFVKWGEAAASYQLLTSADYAKNSYRIGLATAVGVSAAATTGIQGSYMAGAYAVRIVNMAAQSARIAALFVSPVAAAAAVATIVILAITIAVVQGITVINASQLPGQLAELIIGARTPDLKSLVATSDGLTSLFSIFVGATLPAPVEGTCDNSAVVPRGAAFIEGFQVMPKDPECLNPSPIQAASPFDPQFMIQQDGSSTTTRSATITYRGHAANTTTTARLHKNWFITETNGAVAQTLLFTYLDWDGKHQYGYLLGPDDDGDYTFVGMAVDSDTEFKPDTCVADGVCTMSDTLHYLDADGKKMSAKISPHVASTGTPKYPATGDEGEELAFDANDFKPSGAVGEITYQWRFQEDYCRGLGPAKCLLTPPAYGAVVAGETVSHTWGHRGSFSVELTATDSAGKTATTTFEVEVQNTPPTILSFVPDCPKTSAGDPVPGPGCLARAGDPATPLQLRGTFADAGRLDLKVVVNWGDRTVPVWKCVTLATGILAQPRTGWPNCSDGDHFDNGLWLSRTAVDGNEVFEFDASHVYTESGTYYGTMWVTDGVDASAETFTMTIAGPPAAPDDLSADVAPAAGLGSGQVQLAWNAPAANGKPVTDYRVERSSDGFSWVTVPDAVSAATTSILDGVGGPLGVWLRVTAVNAKGIGPPSAAIRVIPKFGPNAPTELTADVAPAGGLGSGQVKLSWGYPLIGEEITGYFVEWSVDGTTWTTVPVEAAARSYTVDGLTSFTPYRFRVRARNSIGVSPPSEIQATPVRGPDAPAGLTAAVAPAQGLDSGQVRLSWAAAAAPVAAPVTDYLIEFSANGSTWTSVNDGVSTATTTTVSGLTNGIQYSFRVAARNAFGNGAWSSAITATPVWGPGTPGGLAAAVAPAAGVGSGQVSLTWNAPASNGKPITDYITEFSANGGTTWTTVNDGVSTATTTMLSGLTNGTQYSFRVAAKNSVGSSPWTPAITATPAWVPGAPSGLTAAAAPTAGVGSGQVKLTWNAPANNGAAITDYTIESSANGGTTWTTVNDGVSTATTTMVSGLTNGTQYSFRVAARNAAGSGASSPAITATPLGAPGAPSGLTAAVAPTTSVGSGQVKLTWNPSQDNGVAITDYVIEFSANGGTTWTTVNDGMSTATTTMVGGLTNGTQYSFRVAGKNAIWISPWTPAITATPAWVPGAPSGLTAAVAPTAGVGSGQVKLTWNAPASNNGAAITDYTIESSANGGTTWTTVNDGVSTATTTTVSGLTNGTQYSFRVAARNAAGSGASSPAVLATPLGPPGAPSGVQAVTPDWDTTQATLTWSAPASNGAAITDYVIEYSVNGVTWMGVIDGVSTATTYTVGGLVYGPMYWFRVTAKNAIGYGLPSTPVKPTVVGSL
jgi:hypothetical protein